jgi:hypothetical protein
MSIEWLQSNAGWFWPYLVVIVIGFLPTEIWRVIGVLAGRGLSDDEPVLQWVRVVATALVAAVVAKLVLTPTGQLATVPLAARMLAIGIGVGMLLATRRSMVAGLIAGELTLIGMTLYLS